jgi:hypothetical protein
MWLSEGQKVIFCAFGPTNFRAFLRFIPIDLFTSILDRQACHAIIFWQKSAGFKVTSVPNLVLFFGLMLNELSVAFPQRRRTALVDLADTIDDIGGRKQSRRK